MSVKSLVLLAAAAMVAVAAWFALRDEAANVAPDRDPDGPDVIVSTTEGDSGTSGGPALPPDDVSEEATREYLKKLRASDWAEVDALGEANAREFAKNPGVVRALVAIAGSRGDPDDRAAALMLLGCSRMPLARSALESAVDGGFGTEFQTAGISALANADPEWAVPLLRDIAVRGGELSHATAAIQALLLQESQGALGAVADALSRAQDDVKRRLAFFEILDGRSPDVGGDEPKLIRLHRGNPGNLFVAPPEIPPEFHDDVRKVLEIAAKEDDPRALPVAARAVAKLPGEDAHRVLGEFWAKGDGGLRQMILMVVDPGRHDGAFPELLRRMPGTKDREARDTASLLLGEVNHEEFVPELRAWLDREGDKEIRSRIEKTIRRLETR